MKSLTDLACIRPGNHVTDKPEILFARLDVKEVLEKAEALQEAQRSAAQAEASGTEEEKKDDEAAIHLEPKEEITFEEFGENAVCGR